MVENQQVEDPPSVKFTWRIENFSSLDAKKLYSEDFVVGDYKWKVAISPKGNNVDHLSMYLEVADSATLPYGWSRYAQFSLAVVNQVHSKYSIRKYAQHQFNARESDWGFTSFMPLSDLYDPSRGYLVNDTCVIEAEVAVRKVLDYWSYNSKKGTGYVGLKNQGATSYMNSLLQTLYHIPYFRKAVYHMPTENDMPSGSIPLALQSLFYKLQYNDSSGATKELTKSFKWDTYDSFMQHDVQELNRVLCEKLEDEMKGTVVEGTMQQLFEGHHMNYIECINVDYKSTRKESFYDLQLDVKGCRDVYASFDKYVEVERLEGDNKYHAEEHGLQDAKKGVLFIDFPPVLQLQLKRFEYDFMRDTMVKINDRYEFPLQLDLDRENGKYLSPDADRSVRNLYTLHSVLVHRGGAHDGHYYAFIRPTLSDQWFKFDDERVTTEDVKRALEEQYGGEEELPQTNPGFNYTPFKFTKYSNAYMLVYIRESDKDKIICNVDEKDIAEHLRIRLKKEQEEKEDKRKYKAQAHLYTIMKVARDEDLAEQIGRDIYFDLVDHDKVRSFRIQNQTPFNLFKEEVAKEFGIPVQFLRFWIWAKRQNHTYRPNRPLAPQEEAQSVGHLREVSNETHNAELKLFLQVELGPDLHPVPPPERTKDDMFLFFKLYDPVKGELRYVGRLFVKSSNMPIEILEKINQMSGFAPDEEIELYEEIKFEPSVMCEHLDKRTSFRLSQIEDGDIICFQKSAPTESEEECRYPDVPSFLEYVHNRQVVHFRSLERPKEVDFCLELSKVHSYDEVVERVARRIGLDDPSKIRLTSHNCYSQQPKPQPIKYRGVEHLSDMLIHYNQTSDKLYYEVLDIPLPELQGLKNLKVAFHHATKEEVVIHNIRLPKQSTVGDVITVLKTKVELSHPNAELRLLEVFYHKIYKIFPHNEKIENINDHYWTLHAEEIPEEEKDLAPHDRLIHVYHFTKETAQNQMQVQNFGEPFFLVMHEGETLSEVKVRVQKKLQVPDEEFSKWKFAFLSMGRPEYLQDSDIVSSHFQRRDMYGAWEQYLGLEHSDNTPKRAYAVNQEIKFEPSVMCERLDKRTSFQQSQVPPQSLISDSVDKDIEKGEEIERECSGMVAVFSTSSLATTGSSWPSVGDLSLGLGKLEELLEIKDEHKRREEEKKRKEEEEREQREAEEQKQNEEENRQIKKRKLEERKYIEEVVKEQKALSSSESNQDKDQAIQSLKISPVALVVPPQILISDSSNKDIKEAEEIERELSGMVAVSLTSSLSSSGSSWPSVGDLSLGLGKLEELLEIKDPKKVLADPSLYSSFETIATLLLRKPEFLGQTKLSALRCFYYDLNLIQKAYTKSLELGKKVEAKETEKKTALDEANGFITRLNSTKSSLKNMRDRKEKLLIELNQLEHSMVEARIQLKQILEEKDQVQRTSTSIKDIEASLQEAKQELEQELELIDDRWFNLRSAFKK